MLLDLKGWRTRDGAGPRLLYLATRTQRDLQKDILLLTGDEELLRCGASLSRKSRWEAKSRLSGTKACKDFRTPTKVAAVSREGGWKSWRKERPWRNRRRCGPALGNLQWPRPLPRGPMGGLDVRMWEARPGCYSLSWAAAAAGAACGA